jgi:hypothetical protein
VAEGAAVAAAFASEVAAAGFDVFGAVAVDAYNAVLEPAFADYRLPDLGCPQALVLLAGNTRRLWPLFLSAYRGSELAHEAHPLDAYSRLHLGCGASRVAERFGVAHAVRYSFDPPPDTVAVQRLAVLTGAAEASPVGLCIHPQHGPWWSLRAALVFALPGPRPTASAPTCSACRERPCLSARNRAIASCGVPPAQITGDIFVKTWRQWLAMRDACPVGRDSRYGESQVEYHYAKDRRALRT